MKPHHHQVKESRELSRQARSACDAAPALRATAQRAPPSSFPSPQSSSARTHTLYTCTPLATTHTLSYSSHPHSSCCGQLSARRRKSTAEHTQQANRECFARRITASPPHSPAPASPPHSSDSCTRATPLSRIDRRWTPPPRARATRAGRLGGLWPPPPLLRRHAAPLLSPPWLAARGRTCSTS